MSPYIHLLVYNIITVVSIVVLLAVSLFVYLKERKKEANIAMALCIFFIAFFFLTHLIGINITDSKLSAKVLSLNIFIVFIGTFNLHAILAVFGKGVEKRLTIIVVHLIAVLLVVLWFVFPNMFFMDSVPKMYFPNYYNPGDLNIIRLIFLFGIIIPYCFYFLHLFYKESTDITRHMQIKYFGISMFAGYIVGFIPNFLVYNINIDPLWGAPTAMIFSIPFVYGLIQYKMFNIKIIAKMALYYSLFVGCIGLAIAFLNYLINLIESINPAFPTWIIYLLSSIIVVILSTIVWRKLKETEQLKYEFITTITHKLRTPMTSIRWATENLKTLDLSEDAKVQIDYIKEENLRLINLTNLLASVSKAENSSYEYNIVSNDLSKPLDDVISMLQIEAKKKNIIIKKNYNQGYFALFDEDRIRFVIQVLIENAIRYSQNDKEILIDLSLQKSKIVCKIEDFGIGISNDQLPKLFNKFYRSEQARLADTEGLGIGLFMAREILFRQGGEIWVESKGENLGSTFYFSLLKGH